MFDQMISGRANNCSSVYFRLSTPFLFDTCNFQYSEGYQEYKSDP